MRTYNEKDEGLRPEYEHDDDDEEFAELITSPNRSASGTALLRRTSDDKEGRCGWGCWPLLLLIVGIFAAVHMHSSGEISSISTDGGPDDKEDVVVAPSIKLKPNVTKSRSKAKDTDSVNGSTMQCPDSVKKSKDDGSDNFDVYEADDVAHTNKTLDEYKTMTYDGWELTFSEVKEMLRPWKEEVFVTNIKSGDSIYESACGIGMNLFLTAEILKEHNITDITVSGNDYVGASIEIANEIWEDKEAKQLANKGMFCRGDSSNLDYIPDESFDFVYTGYIDPIVDPLNRFPSMSVDDQWEYDADLCNEDGDNSKHLAKQAQKAQQKWFASWVEELVRLAKPGKGIAIESGAESLCKNQGDWGGVDKEFWGRAIQKYQWDVDPSSLIIRDEEKWVDRYHVFMRKNK